jgi:outer membrane protein assembly factor BamB
MNARALCGGILLCAVAALAACSSSGPKPAKLVDFKPQATLRIAWHAAVGGAGRYLFRPALRDGMLYAAGSDGRLAKFDAGTGRRLWQVDTGVRLSGGVGLGAGSILAGSAKGMVLAYDGDGKQLWRSKVSSEVLSAPVGDDTTVVVRSGDSRVFGLDAGDGSRKWEYQATSPPLTLRAAPGMVFAGDHAAVAGFPGGRLLVLNTQTGVVMWETTVATPRGDNELERIADIAGLPLVAPDQVCAVTYQGRIGCYETQRGRQLWVRPASSAGSLSSSGSLLYYTEENGSVVALDRASGASVWKQDKLFGRKVSAPAAFGNYVVVGDYQGYVHFLSREDGAFVARIGTDGGPILAQPLVFEQTVLVQTARGGLYAIAQRERRG